MLFFLQLGSLINVVQQHIRNYLDAIFDLIKDFWSVDSPLQPTIILLVENIAVALGSEFKIYLPQLIPQILRVLLHDTSRGRSVTGLWSKTQFPFVCSSIFQLRK